MANEFNLTVNKRELSNKGGRKQLRKLGKVPGVFYSHDSKKSTLFYINIADLKDAQKSGSRVFNINVGNKKRTVLFKSVQYHPITDEIIHVDLYGIKMDEVVVVNVLVKLLGTAKGVQEEGGRVLGDRAPVPRLAAGGQAEEVGGRPRGAQEARRRAQGARRGHAP